MTKSEKNKPNQMEDGSDLPPFLSGVEALKPLKADVERTVFYATDTKNKYMFISNEWILIETLK